ncbi:MAG: thioesterase family protein [Marmoricola sp.]
MADRTVADSTVVWQELVQPEWIDYNGHLSEAYYVLVFGHATDAVLERVGLGADYRDRTSCSLFTVEEHIRYLDQVSEGAELEIRSSVVGAAEKTLHVWHEMWADGRLRATEEVLGVHVDAVAGRAAAFPGDVLALVEEVRVEPPADASRRIRV